jgi:hypothetical protein
MLDIALKKQLAKPLLWDFFGPRGSVYT